MKKIWSWLTGSVIKEVGGILDNLTTTKEEKLEAQRLITEILEKADKEARERQKAAKAKEFAEKAAAAEASKAAEAPAEVAAEETTAAEEAPAAEGEE